MIGFANTMLVRERKTTGNKMLDQLGTFHKLPREHAIPKGTRK